MSDRLFRASLDAWRSVLQPLDRSVRAPFSALAAERGDVSAGDRWLAAARWWTAGLPETLTEHRGTAGTYAGHAAAELLRRLRGRRVHIELDGLHVEAVLESVRLERREGRLRARVELCDVLCDGLRFDELSVIADSFALTPPPQLALTASGVELQGQSTLESLIAWLNRKLPLWQLGLTEGGEIEVVRARGGVRLVIEPCVRDGELDVELRAVGWGGAQLRAPKWLRVTRRLPLPTLPRGTVVTEARRRGSNVDLRLSLPVVSRRFDPAALHSATSRDP